MFSAMPNSRVLLEALENGLFPQSMIDIIDQGSPCGFISGNTTITSEMYVPEGGNLLSITGIFIPDDDTPIEDIKVTLYGIDSVRGASDIAPVDTLPPQGTFEIVLIDPLPGRIPYFLVFTVKDCNFIDGSRNLEEESQSFGVSIVYVSNTNEVKKDQMTITLTWDEGYSDVDLHIVGPNGDHVYYGPDKGANGELDYDERNGWGPEHFISQKPLVGVYKFYVNLFSRKNIVTPAPPIPWKLSARIGTTVLWTETGTFSDPNLLAQQDDDNFSLMAGPFQLDTSKVGSGEEFNSIIYMLLEEFILEEAPVPPPAPKPQHVPPLAATDWFSIARETSQGEINFLYEFEEGRDHSDVASEKLYESKLNQWMDEWKIF